MAKDKKKIKSKISSKKNVRYTNVKDMDDLYKVLNKVQLNKKEVRLLIKDSSVREIIENTLKDLNLIYKRLSYVSKTVYRIYPNKEIFDKDITEDDFNKEFNL